MSAGASEHRFKALGTGAVVIVNGEPEALAAAVRAAQAVIDEVDAACSRFRDDSDLAAVNRAGGEPVEVSDVLIDAVRLALRAAVLTDGRVVPTVGRVMRVLGYDRDFASVGRSGPPLQVTVGAVPGWQVVTIDPEARTIRVPPGVELDLGATAKAWCADRAAQAAAAATETGVLVSLGGDVAVAGDAPAHGWAVRVTDDHAAPVDAPGQTVSLSAGGLATSGTSVRQWERGGVALHHVVDPATGLPADSPWRTVSVTAGSCADANVASTASLVMGEAARAWLEGLGLPARLVASDGSVTTVAGWPPDSAQARDGSRPVVGAGWR